MYACMHAKQVHISGLEPGLASNLVVPLARTNKDPFSQSKATCYRILSKRGKS